MDLRKELPKGSFLNFPGMNCRILETVGKGSNGIVYLAEYQDAMSSEQHKVLIKELFPLEKKGAIYRTENGEIVRKLDGEALWEIHQESFERGISFHLKLLDAHPEMIGGNLNTFELNGTYYTVFGCSGGSTLDHLPKEGLTLRKIAERMLLILDALEVFHQEGFLHMDISPDNILVIPQGERENIILIDYNSVSSVDEWQMGIAPVSSTKEGYSAPEAVDEDSDEIGFPTDLYSVAAVFYDCLMGRPLSLSETIAPSTPTGAESKYLAGAPETVRAMVKRILHRGLNTLVSRRYADIAAMRKDLKELLDRIDCVGVTHAALWEKERARQTQMVRENPSLSFLEEKDSLYPIRIENGDESLDLPAFLRKTKENRGRMILLQAQGGMGKTTAFMAAAQKQNEHYSPAEPVAVLLSAFDYREGEQWFIHDRILQSLRFKQDTKNYGNARHELDVLLQMPLRTANGERPCVLLFVDGLNEIACDTSLLFKELNELSAFAGVSVVLSSRTVPEGIQPRLMTLSPLEKADIEDILSSAHMLIPESAAMQELLRTPLLLSAFVRASGDNRIQDEDGLLQAMLQKELDRIPADQPEHWQLDAALHYVLPAIAAEQQKKKRMLSEKELLKAVSVCFGVMKSKEMMHAFPQLLGHRKEVLGNAKRSDDWYGKVVLELLWRRTGFLVRSEVGFRVVHQQIAEWLAKQYEKIRKQIARRKTIRLCRRALACTLLMVILIGQIWYFVNADNRKILAEQYVQSGSEADEAGEQHKALMYYAKAMELNPDDGFAADAAYVMLQKYIWPSYEGIVHDVERPSAFSNKETEWKLDTAEKGIIKFCNSKINDTFFINLDLEGSNYLGNYRDDQIVYNVNGDEVTIYYGGIIYLCSRDGENANYKNKIDLGDLIQHDEKEIMDEEETITIRSISVELSANGNYGLFEIDGQTIYDMMDDYYRKTFLVNFATGKIDSEYGRGVYAQFSESGERFLVRDTNNRRLLIYYLGKGEKYSIASIADQLYDSTSDCTLYRFNADETLLLLYGSYKKAYLMELETKVISEIVYDGCLSGDVWFSQDSNYVYVYDGDKDYIKKYKLNCFKCADNDQSPTEALNDLLSSYRKEPKFSSGLVLKTEFEDDTRNAPCTLCLYDSAGNLKDNVKLTGFSSSCTHGDVYWNKDDENVCYISGGAVLVVNIDEKNQKINKTSTIILTETYRYHPLCTANGLIIFNTLNKYIQYYKDYDSSLPGIKMDLHNWTDPDVDYPRYKIWNSCIAVYKINRSDDYGNPSGCINHLESTLEVWNYEKGIKLFELVCYDQDSIRLKTNDSFLIENIGSRTYEISAPSSNGKTIKFLHDLSGYEMADTAKIKFSEPVTDNSLGAWSDSLQY